MGNEVKLRLKFAVVVVFFYMKFSHSASAFLGT